MVVPYTDRTAGFSFAGGTTYVFFFMEPVLYRKYPTAMAQGH